MTRTNLAFDSRSPVDQIFQVVTGTLSISNAAPSPVADRAINLDPNDGASVTANVAPFFEGTFTLDSDPTVYNMADFNGAALYNPLGVGVTANIVWDVGPGTPPYVEISGFVATGSPIPDSNTHMINYSVVLFNNIVQTGIVIPDVTNNLTLNFNSEYNTQSVFLEDFSTFTLSSTTTNSLVIPHNLGKKPFYRAFYQYLLGNHLFQDNLLTEFYIDASVDNNNITLTCNKDVWARYGWAATQNGTLHYRIYY